MWRYAPHFICISSVPIWGIAAQLSVAFVTALVAIAVYRIQADKLFLEFRDKRDQALTAFVTACHNRLLAISTISTADLVGLIDPEKLEAGNREVMLTAQVLRSWFGSEVHTAALGCEAAMMTALRTKMEWCVSPQVNNFSKVSEAHLEAYTSINLVRLAAGPYINAGRRGLGGWQRIRATIAMGRSGNRALP